MNAVVERAAPWVLPPAFEAMRPFKQWFIYRLSERDPATGKYKKQPIDPRTRMMPPKDQGGLAMCTDYATVAQIGAELQAAARAGEAYLPGFWFAASDPFWFLDIDGCLVGGAWTSLALELLGALANASRELSSSGQGLHVIGSGAVPDHGCKNTALALEFYTQDRGIALTFSQASGSAASDCTAAIVGVVAQYFPPSVARVDGEWTDTPRADWHGPPNTPEGDAALIEKAKRSRSAGAAFGGKVSFAALWDADPDKLGAAFPSSSRDAWDQSAADMALASHLGYWCGGDCERVLRLMQQSALVRGKWEREEYVRGTVAKACATITKSYNDGKGPKAAASAPPADPAATEDDPREVILLRGGKLDQIAVQAEQLIAGTIYVRGGRLVRIGRAAEVANDSMLDAVGTRRDATQAICIPASAAWLRRELMARAQFWKYDKRSAEWEPKDCPKELAENIGDQEAWASFRSLVAITPVPILRADMSVWIEPGYDAVTGNFYQPTMTVPEFPAVPTRDDAYQALTRLWEPFSEFPFATPAAASVFLANVISAVLRASFDTSPIFLYTAPMAATGKTLLADMSALIAHGVIPAHNPYSEGDELRKVLFSSLLAGDASLILDNVPGGIKVRAPGLCNFVTSATVGDRVLGVSETRKVPNRCTVVLTGNNITPAGDMARRSLPCRLDVNAETARGRKFRIKDLKGYVRQVRPQLIVDVLTIVRGYAFAGRPEVASPLESFEHWSTLVRDPLVWLGMADPVTSQETETDDEVAPLKDAFTAIAAATQQQGYKFTAGSLASLTIPQGPTATAGKTASALKDALASAGCAEPGEAKKLGYWLREHKDRVAAGWKLMSDKTVHGGAAGWRLQGVER
jgi:hypothetical protein